MVTLEDPGFVDYAKKNFALRKDAAVYKAIPSFAEIPFSKMGVTTKLNRPEDKNKVK
jgi:hypothetical protein